MYRKDLIGILKSQPTSLNDLALMLKMDKKDLEEDLKHLIRSLRTGPENVTVTPACCRKCGFAFHNDKLHKPGKCPRCKGTWISEPVIGIEKKR